MKPYLQRLYDAAAGSAAAVEARPAQRSSSPLLAVDQRLASPAYAGSFLLGLPGAADRDAAPPPESDPVTFPEPDRPEPAPTPVEGSVPVASPRPAAPAVPRPAAEDRVVVRPGLVVDPPVPPAVVAPEPAAVRTPVAPSPTPVTRSVPPAVEVRTRPVVEQTSPPEPEPEPAPRTVAERPAVSRVVEPVRPGQPGRLRALPDTPPRPEKEHRRPSSTTAPASVRPVPRPAAEPLPPPPAPRPAEPADLADQVRRLVREAMAGDDAPRRTSRDQREGPVAEPAATASPARTAESLSVIGPLDRPARATTLYGLRLR